MRFTFVALLLAFFLLSACSGNGGGFGDPADAGDAGLAGDAASEDTGRLLSAVGEACLTPSDCVEEALCVGRMPEGFECMARCDAPYELCDDGRVCLPVMTMDASICYSGGERAPRDTCDTNLECDDGLLCFGATNDFYCLEACADASDCAPGELCEKIASGAGLCRLEVGRDCSTDADCGADLTCTMSHTDLAGIFPGGYCTLLDCTTDIECPGVARCRDIPVADGARSLCLAPCEDRSDCRFNDVYDCVDESQCASSSSPSQCEAMLASGPLCLPGPL